MGKSAETVSVLEQVHSALRGVPTLALIESELAPLRFGFSGKLCIHPSQVAMVHDAFGTLQGLVNCAGVSPAETVLGKRGVHRLDSFMRTVRINLVGTFNMIRLAAEMMSTGAPNEEGERGVIVNTASAAAFEGQVGQAGYSASKGGVVAMTLPIARELARWGIRNATIAPGVFETPLMRELSNEKRETMLKRVPFPSRAGRPSEFAQLVQQIFENPMLNGEVIRLDGALRLASS